MTKNNPSNFTVLNLREELVFTASRSSGPGGQNVNKVSTKVELRFNIPASKLLSEEQKQMLLSKLNHRLTLDGELIVVSQDSRSQLKNRETALEKLYQIIEKALKPARKRISTKPTVSSKEKRLGQKKNLSKKKEQRKPPLEENH